MSDEEEDLNEQVAGHADQFDLVAKEIGRFLVGQEKQLRSLMIGLLCNGHILIESVPGLAKTLAVNLLAQSVAVSFSRIQFTPDLLPADLIGTQIYNPKEHSFEIRKGPIFASIILADEINRAPAKVQSALLEAMQEKQVSIGGSRFELPNPFLVMATQNPIEQEGTYRLPEAQMDRFMLKIVLDYPSREEESVILERMAHPDLEIVANKVIGQQDILDARQCLDQIYLDKKVENYILDLVFCSRLAFDQLSDHQNKEQFKFLEPLIERGASPRASLSLCLAAKAHALLEKRAHVVPDDVLAVAVDVLRHRIAISYEAEAESLDSASIIGQIITKLAIL